MRPGALSPPCNHGPPLAALASMQVFEVDTGRWRLEFDGGLGLELVMLFSKSFAFWRFGGSLVREASICEG